MMPTRWSFTSSQDRRKCKSAAASIWFGDGNASFTGVYSLFSVVAFASAVNVCIKCPTFSYSQFFCHFSTYFYNFIDGKKHRFYLVGFDCNVNLVR
jgi:hypothetical protein